MLLCHKFYGPEVEENYVRFLKNRVGDVRSHKQGENTQKNSLLPQIKVENNKKNSLWSHSCDAKAPDTLSDRDEDSSCPGIVTVLGLPRVNRLQTTFLSFFLGFWRPNLITGLSGWRTPDYLSGASKTLFKDFFLNISQTFNRLGPVKVHGDRRLVNLKSGEFREDPRNWRPYF